MSGIFIALFIIGIISGLAINHLLTRMDYLHKSQKQLLKCLEKQKERLDEIEKSVIHLFGVIGVIHSFHLNRRSSGEKDGSSYGEEWKETNDEEEEEQPQEIPWVNEFIEKHGRNHPTNIQDDDPLKGFFEES